MAHSITIFDDQIELNRMIIVKRALLPYQYIRARAISYLSAPSAHSINYCQGVLSQDDPLSFVLGALHYDHRIADLSGLGYNAMAVD